MRPVASKINEVGSGFCIKTPAWACVNPDVETAVGLSSVKAAVVKGVVRAAKGNGVKILVLLTTTGVAAPVNGNGFSTFPLPITDIEGDVTTVGMDAAATEEGDATALFGKKGALPEPDRTSVTTPLPGNARGAAAPANGNGLKMLVLLDANGALAPANGNGLKILSPVKDNGAAAPVKGKGLKTLVLFETRGALAPANGKGLKTLPLDTEVNGTPTVGVTRMIWP
ncbi:MAG TPA: hypothetical protein VJ692_05255 [Nitrospiraceae bacterium]|nr:hypothetical protein [Nitrospiraceae bacterium]